MSSAVNGLWYSVSISSPQCIWVSAACVLIKTTYALWFMMGQANIWGMRKHICKCISLRDYLTTAKNCESLVKTAKHLFVLYKLSAAIKLFLTKTAHLEVV